MKMTCLESVFTAASFTVPTEPLVVLAARAACARDCSIQPFVQASDQNLGHLAVQAARDIHGLLRQALERGAQAKADAAPPTCPVCGHKLTRCSGGQAPSFECRHGSSTVARTRGYCKRGRKGRTPADAFLGLEESAGYLPAM